MWLWCGSVFVLVVGLSLVVLRFRCVHYFANDFYGDGEVYEMVLVPGRGTDSLLAGQK